MQAWCSADIPSDLIKIVLVFSIQYSVYLFIVLIQLMSQYMYV